ncbi:MAG: carbamoyltransferase HypF, partial [Planctomycetota bacterium]|nr:carbamoyltransferase HypF [Planctomycetota bacterium]
CLAKGDQALRQTAQAIREGSIVAVKGLGGFHLMADARDGRALARLRERKQREEKPLAVMYPSLQEVQRDCQVSPLEQRCLLSPECPIVLLRRSDRAVVAAEVAPGNPDLGALLPYTPLHHLLLRDVGCPLVATSGNLSEEPICTDQQDALARLGGIADLFLVHNRPIVRHVDDSIVRVMLGREQVLRRARGYAPLPLRLPQPQPPLLAVGAHLKNTVALTVGSNVFISQHIGDLENEESIQAFRHVIDSFRQLYGVPPERVAADMHPDYVSTRFAHSTGLPVVPIQHHFAHVVSCMAENDLTGEILGVAWDGTGYGLEGTIWGGEFLVTDGVSLRRAAAFRKFRLPGGAQAVREPRRSALGALYEIFGDGLFDRAELATIRAFAASELSILRTMLGRGLNTPWTSSAGRLFDALASILGLRQRAGFEGQAAMDVEFAALDISSRGTLAFAIREPSCSDRDQTVSPIGPDYVVDWQPMVLELIARIGGGESAPVLAAEFHHALAEAIVQVARRTGQSRVVLTGGCFQNRLLTECAVRQLEAADLRPYWHQRIPPNDGGIALGQAVAATRLSAEES